MFKGYTPELHEIAQNQAVLLSFDYGNGTGKIDLKIGKQVRRILNAVIEDEGRRKKFSHTVNNSKTEKVVLQGSRYLIMTDFNNKLKQEWIDEAIVDQTFTNNGSTLSYYLHHYSQDNVQEVVEGIVKVLKCAINYAMEKEMPNIPDTFDIANKTISNTPKQTVTIVLST